MKDAKEKLTVIGVGNSFRGDDAFGIECLNFLETHFPGKANYKYIIDVVPPDTISSFEGENLLILDAIRCELSPGTLLFPSVDQLESGKLSFGASSHMWGVAESYKLAKALGKAPKKLKLAGVVGGSWDLGHTMTREVKASIKKIGDWFDSYLKSLEGDNFSTQPV